MNINTVSNNQLGFSSLKVIPKGKTNSILMENFSNSLGKDFTKNVLEPAKSMRNDICVNCNDNSVHIMQGGLSLDSFGKYLAKVSSKDERVVEYRNNNGERFNIEYESGAEAESSAWGLNFGDFKEKAKAVFDIQSRVEKFGVKELYRF